MDTAIVIIYCICDDFLKAQKHRENQQVLMTDAEVLTTALVAMRYFAGNFEHARDLLQQPRYIPTMLSKSHFNRRLHRLESVIVQLIEVFGAQWKHQSDDQVFLIDSFPIAVCDNIRIKRCRIYPHENTEGVFRGYIASKRRYFYGLKLHLVTTSAGRPVEMVLSPGSYSDVRRLDDFNFDLSEHAVVYGDKAYNDYRFEDTLLEATGIRLAPIRKKNSKRALSVSASYLQHHARKMIETVGSLITAMLPKSIHAVTARGFELKVVLFVLAYSITTGL